MYPKVDSDHAYEYACICLREYVWYSHALTLSMAMSQNRYSRIDVDILMIFFFYRNKKGTMTLNCMRSLSKVLSRHPRENNKRNV